MCASFAELFRNTLLLRLPADLMITCTEQDMSVLGADDTGFVGFGQHDLSEQMDEGYGKENVNLKINLDFMFLSDSPAKIVITPPDYHFDEELSCLKPMLGVLPILSNTGIEFALNTVASLSYLKEKREVYIKKGTPLAYLYFPNGAPSSVDYVSSDEYRGARFTRTTFFGEYVREANSK